MGLQVLYAFMQNVGVVNGHVHGRFRATGYPTTARVLWLSILATLFLS